MPRSLSLSQLRTALHRLTLEQARDLQRELSSVIQELEQQTEPLALPPRKGREILQVQRVDDRLYQLERVRCGKPNCKCVGENAELHGPYWYAYWREDGKLKSRYIGKNLAPNSP
ncbi:MAG: hypothetical protein MUC48_25415 [Leptolyngbya sp. Prado105]|nr:hypothetical protein [Leptolyngbya sp. Prado105]